MKLNDTQTDGQTEHTYILKLKNSTSSVHVLKELTLQNEGRVVMF